MAENDENLGFGPTGDFPEGKLNETDEGGLFMGVTHQGDTVVVNFGKPVAWIGLKAHQAMHLAQLLVRHAVAVEAETEGLPTDE